MGYFEQKFADFWVIKEKLFFNPTAQYVMSKKILLGKTKNVAYYFEEQRPDHINTIRSSDCDKVQTNHI